MSQSKWRDHCAPIINRVLKETAGQDEKAIQKALRDAYPYGAFENHPYKIWRSEIHRQRGTQHTHSQSNKRLQTRLQKIYSPQAKQLVLLDEKV